MTSHKPLLLIGSVSKIEKITDAEITQYFKPIVRGAHRHLPLIENDANSTIKNFLAS